MHELIEFNLQNLTPLEKETLTLNIDCAMSDFDSYFTVSKSIVELIAICYPEIFKKMSQKLVNI